jgi:hypothetical protein
MQQIVSLPKWQLLADGQLEVIEEWVWSEQNVYAQGVTSIQTNWNILALYYKVVTIDDMSALFHCYPFLQLILLILGIFSANYQTHNSPLGL